MYHLNRWLQFALAAGIEELTLHVTPYYGKNYNFPCSLLFDRSGNTIQHLRLSHCTFRPTVGFGSLRTLRLVMVRTTGDELECLLSNSFELEELSLMHCEGIICLKIPSLLQHLSYLHVFECTKLKEIESKAPNLSRFLFGGARIQPSFGDFLPVKNIELTMSKYMIHYACAKLTSIAPNLQTLDILSTRERFNTPIVPIKFLHLKYLSICLYGGAWAFSPSYDYFSLVFLLDACPILETFFMSVVQTRMKHDSIIEDPSHLRKMPEYCHAYLKNVTIIGFCSAKSMVELAYHIIENSSSLECLTVDTY